MYNVKQFEVFGSQSQPSAALADEVCRTWAKGHPTVTAGSVPVVTSLADSGVWADEKGARPCYAIDHYGSNHVFRWDFVSTGGEQYLLLIVMTRTASAPRDVRNVACEPAIPDTASVVFSDQDNAAFTSLPFCLHNPPPSLLRPDQAFIESAMAAPPVLNTAAVRKALMSFDWGKHVGTPILVAVLCLIPPFVEYRASGSALFATIYGILRVAGPFVAAALVLYAIYSTLRGISTRVQGKIARDLSIADTEKVLNLAVGPEFSPILQSIVVPCFWERAGFRSPDDYKTLRWGEAGYMKDFDRFVLRGMIPKVAERISKSSGAVSTTEVEKYLKANLGKLVLAHYGVRLTKTAADNVVEKCEAERQYKVVTYDSTPAQAGKVEKVTLDSLRLEGCACFTFKHDVELIRREHDYLVVDPRDPIELHYLELRSTEADQMRQEASTGTA